MRILANENVPKETVDALRERKHALTPRGQVIERFFNGLSLRNGS
jgi:hypothetical protein